MDAPGLARSLDDLEQYQGHDIGANLASATAIELQARACGETVLQLRARLVRADMEQRNGDRGSAAQVFLEVRRRAQDLGSRPLLARSHFHLALTYNYLGDHAASLEHAISATELLEEDAAPGLRVIYLLRLANALGDVGSIAAARERYREAEQLAIAMGDLHRRLQVLNNRAYTEFEAGELAAAATVAGRMRVVAATLGRGFLIVERDTVANIEIALGRYAAAEQTLLSLVETPLWYEMHDLAEAILTLARAQRGIGALRRAQQSLDRSRALCEERELTGVGVAVMAEQAELYAATGAFEQAFVEYKRYHAAGELLRSAQQEARASTRQVMFETAQARNDAERYREQALRDPLTGLHNRRYVDDHLPAAVALAAETRSPLTIALVDIDHFKRINDTLSHDTGDEVLVAVAQQLRSVQQTVAETGFVARMGGEEFLVVLPGIAAGQAASTLEALRQAVASHRWRPVTGELPVTVSVGATATLGDDAVPALLADADRMLYAAKNAGRDRVMVLATAA
ncbi:GGDEF domain-containing protein [Couchioplanes caeruleus]|uniref:GGDEF domain-containing protein n=1 Tax=Couchioplanes caeruleus TaxID=56438 RepID=UPI0020C01076|nr:GGDEF domain-containing protein [Couchioplanes caeruleus]UQU62802.1 GGDEF domain-containing protein [Couchioplanes caeruleus]